jgi:hypothetical protein
MPPKCLGTLRRQFAILRGDAGGNVAIIFALALLPVVGSVAAAVDYSRANSARTAMQAAADATALMLSKEPPTLTKSQLNDKADKYLRANLMRPEAHDLVVNAALENSKSGRFLFSVKSDGKVDTTFARVFGMSYIHIDVSSQVQWGMKKLELALALDNTGSMGHSNKMEELQKAAQNLLDTLKKSEKDKGDIKVAIVPFDTTVHIGTQAKDLPWFDWSLVPQNVWTGCIADRAQPFDVRDTAPDVIDPATLFPAVNCGSLAKLMPLTSDWSALKKKIKEMEPNGNTNVTLGLVWAWHALTPNAPLNEASAPRDDLEKVIILLTDGDNTRSLKSKKGKIERQWNNNTTEINLRTEAVCQNIKATGIKVYTVRVIEGNADLLKACATTRDLAFNVETASQLDSVFKSIASKLISLYISK